MVEPYDDNHALGEGETVRLDRREGNIFIALARVDGTGSSFDALPTPNWPISTGRD